MYDGRTNISDCGDSASCSPSSNISIESGTSKENIKITIKDKLEQLAGEFKSVREQLKGFGISEDSITRESLQCAGEFLRLRTLKLDILNAINSILAQN